METCIWRRSPRSEHGGQIRPLCLICREGKLAGRKRRWPPATKPISRAPRWEPVTRPTNRIHRRSPATKPIKIPQAPRWTKPIISQITNILVCTFVSSVLRGIEALVCTFLRWKILAIGSSFTLIDTPT